MWAPGVPPPGVLRFTGVLLGVTLLLVVVLIWLGLAHHGRASWHFHEDRAGTFSSGALLLACAVLSFRIRGVGPRRVARFWLVAAAGFVFLAYDELSLFHEGIDKWIHARFGWRDDNPLTDPLDDLIVLVYGIVALAWGFRYRATLLQLRWATLLMAAAFATFLAMALLDITNLGKAAEESLKVLSEALIVSGLFAALRDPALADPA